MSTIVALGVGIEGLPILERVRAAGHRIVAVDANPQAPGFALADSRIVASCYDAAETVDGLATWLQFREQQDRLVKLDAVLCCAIDAPNVAAAVAARFGLPGLTPAQAVLSCDKLAQKRTFKAAGVPVPDFWGLPLEVPAASIRRDNIVGIVIKPVDSRGARGVQLFKVEDGKFDAYAAMLNSQEFSPTGRVMLEQYLTGPQFSTESLVQDSHVLWTGISLRNYDRLEEYAPHIIEDGFDAPYGEDDFRDQIEILLERACRALGWFQQGGGVVKGDLVLHDDRLYIIELAARLSGGFLSTHGWPLAYGMPFVDYAIKLALGRAVYVAESGAWRQAVCQRYLFPKREWIGKSISSVPAIGLPTMEIYPDVQLGHRSRKDMFKPLEGIRFSTYAVAPGYVIRPVTDHAARLGQAIAVGDTPEQAAQRASAAVEAMREGIVKE